MLMAMLIEFDPVIFSFGAVEVRWYGLMYVVGFTMGGWLLGKLSQQKFWRVPKEQIDLFITYLLVGMFIGARSFYVFIYNWDEYSQNFLDVFAVWKGGLSFHGAIVGMATAMAIFARRRGLHLLEITDASALAGAQGLLWGRIGNFINGELYGRVTDVPWAMIFPAGGPLLRHPSQLYEGILEGIFLSIVLWAIKQRVKIHGIITACFLAGYGIIRFGVEFFREPDAQLGFFLGNSVTMGQILCAIMVVIGFVVYLISKRHGLKITKT